MSSVEGEAKAVKENSLDQGTPAVEVLTASPSPTRQKRSQEQHLAQDGTSDQSLQRFAPQKNPSLSVIPAARLK